MDAIVKATRKRVTFFKFFFNSMINIFPTDIKKKNKKKIKNIKAQLMFSRSAMEKYSIK